MSAPYWLIERGSPCEWFISKCGPHDEWTTDVAKAARFTEWGAKKHAPELEQMGVRGPLRATEHVDCDGPDLGGAKP